MRGIRVIRRPTTSNKLIENESGVVEISIHCAIPCSSIGKVEISSCGDCNCVPSSKVTSTMENEIVTFKDDESDVQLSSWCSSYDHPGRLTNSIRIVLIVTRYACICARI